MPGTPSGAEGPATIMDAQGGSSLPKPCPSPPSNTRLGHLPNRSPWKERGWSSPRGYDACRWSRPLNTAAFICLLRYVAYLPKTLIQSRPLGVSLQLPFRISNPVYQGVRFTLVRPYAPKLPSTRVLYLVYIMNQSKYNVE